MTAVSIKEIFNVKWNPDLAHQALLAQLANRRKPWANTKDRAEVSGGGKKPWQQKGTGRARQGSIRSPLWKGGGVSFGPLKERNFTQKINVKMKRLAILSILSKKFKDGEVKIIEQFAITDHKTKNLNLFLKKLAVVPGSFLLITGETDKKLFLAGRNLPKVKIIHPENMNVYDLLCYKNIIMDNSALNRLKENKLK